MARGEIKILCVLFEIPRVCSPEDAWLFEILHLRLTTSVYGIADQPKGQRIKVKSDDPSERDLTDGSH